MTITPLDDMNPTCSLFCFRKYKSTSIMLHSITLILWAAGLSGLIYSYRKWASYRAFRAAALQHGCKRPPKYPHTDPFFGTDLVRDRKKFAAEGRFLKSNEQIFDRLGVKTYEERFFDVSIIATKEARNFQQVAALSFHDYGKANLISTAAMIGNGILFQDGPVWKHSRNLIKPTFARSEISDAAMFGRHLNRFLEGIPRDGTTIDLQVPLHRLVSAPLFLQPLHFTNPLVLVSRRSFRIHTWRFYGLTAPR
jgi:hypothetical protein